MILQLIEPTPLQSDKDNGQEEVLLEIVQRTGWKVAGHCVKAALCVRCNKEWKC